MRSVARTEQAIPGSLDNHVKYDATVIPILTTRLVLSSMLLPSLPNLTLLVAYLDGDPVGVVEV